MEQLELKFDDNLEHKVSKEFSDIKSVWEAFHFAKANDPHQGIRYSRAYYVPATIKETKSILKSMYPSSKRDINNLNSKQAKLVYHTIRKFLSSRQ